MKLKHGFITHETENEQIMVSTEKKVVSGLIRSNKTAALIVNKLKVETSKEEIVQEFLNRYDGSRKIAERDIENILQQLKNIGALDE